MKETAPNLLSFEQRPTFILSANTCSSECRELHPTGCEFQVKSQINPHMKVGAVSTDAATEQHESFANYLRKSGAEVIELPFIHGAYDSVFIKDAAVLAHTKKGSFALLAKPCFKSRQVEPQERASEFKKLGFKTYDVHENFEGGDFVMLPDLSGAFLGYGFRSSKKSAKELTEFLDLPIVCLELRDPHFYHLDTALNFTLDLTSDSPRVIAFAYKDAFTDQSWNLLTDNGKVDQVIPVDREEAMNFGLNWVEVNQTVVLGKRTPKLISHLKNIGKKVHVCPLDQFQLAGGSAACLSAPVFPLYSRNSNQQKYEI